MEKLQVANNLFHQDIRRFWNVSYIKATDRTTNNKDKNSSTNNVHTKYKWHKYTCLSTDVFSKNKINHSAKFKRMLPFFISIKMVLEKKHFKAPCFMGWEQKHKQVQTFISEQETFYIAEHANIYVYIF